MRGWHSFIASGINVVVSLYVHSQVHCDGWLCGVAINVHLWSTYPSSLLPQLEHREVDLLDILEVCQELGLPRLQAACLEYLSLSLEASTVCPLLGEVEALISSSSDQPNEAFSPVRDMCMRFIERRAREVVQTESFLKLSKETVVCVVKSDKVGRSGHSCLVKQCVLDKAI